MKRQIFTIILSTLFLCGCAVKPTSSQYDSMLKSFEGWANYQKQLVGGLWEATPLGSYIIEDFEPEDGVLIGDEENSPYLYLNYTSRDLDGTITGTTDASTAKQLGMELGNDYYGPVLWDRTGTVKKVLSAGLEEALSTMRVGGRRKIAIPSWLNMYGRYKDKESYLINKKDYVTSSDQIYDIEIIDRIEDPEKWQIDSMTNYLMHNYGRCDTLKYGLFYNRLSTGRNVERTNGDTIKVNYIGTLLNGTIFDTNIKEIAMIGKIYNDQMIYEPMELVWNEDYTEITIAGSESSKPVDGFSYIIHQMKPGESGIVVFYYKLGYGVVDQGNTIPAYSSLSFSLTMVE